MPANNFVVDNRPATDAFAITTGDTAAANFTMIRSLYVGGSGNASIVTPQGNAVTLVGLVAGTVIPICAIRVNTTNTTATNLVGFL